MRIKIVGKVTPDRLVKAFEEAVQQFSKIKSGLVLSGANIYFNAFDSDGVMYDLVEDDNQQVMIDQMPESREQEFNLNRNIRRKRVKISSLTRENPDKPTFPVRPKSFKTLSPEQACSALDEITDALVECLPDQFIYFLNSLIEERLPYYKKIITNSSTDFPVYALNDSGLQLKSECWNKPKSVNRPWLSARRDFHLSVSNYYDYETGLESGIIDLMEVMICYLGEDVLRTLNCDVFAKKNKKVIYSYLFMDNLKFIESRLDFLSKQFFVLDDICKDLVRLSGGALIEKINKTIESSWEEVCMATLPPMPKFGIDELFDENGFIVTSETWKTSRYVKNPFRKVNSQDAFPLWANKPWALAEDKIKNIIIAECIELKLPYSDPKSLIEDILEQRVDTYGKPTLRLAT